MSVTKHALIIFSFPEPEDRKKWAWLINKCKAVFSNEHGVIVHAAREAMAEDILALMVRPVNVEVPELTDGVAKNVLDTSDQTSAQNFTNIGDECFTDGLVISYKGENYYKACNEFVMDLPGGGQSFCVRRQGHHGEIHENFNGDTREHIPGCG